MKPPLSYIPLLPIVIGFIIGTAIGDFSWPLYLAILPALLSAILLWRGLSLWGISIMAISIGWLNAAVRMPAPIDQSQTANPTQYRAIVNDITESENSRHLTVDIDGVGLCRITTPSLFPIIICGDSIAFTTCLEKPQNRHDLPLEWDIETYMHHKGIVAIAYLQPEKISVIGHSNDLYWKLRQLRDKVTSIIGESNLSDPTIAFYIATITGDDSFLTDDSREQYSRSGLAHILALSGLHVAIIATVIAALLFPLHLMRQRKLRYIITIIILWIYAIVTGLSPSVTRAVVMTSLFLIALMIERRNSSLNALCFAALVILLFSPLSLYSIGFQLSFCAVASILIFANRMNPISPRHKIAYHLTSLITVSISAMIGTGLISAYYFHTFPVYFLLSNIIVLLILPFVLGGGILLTLLLAFGIDAQWLCIALDFGYGIISNTCELCNSLPGATIDNIYFNPWLLIPYFATCATLLAGLVYRKTILYFATATTAAITVLLFSLNREQYPNKEFYFPRDTYYTNIIAREKSTLYLFTTAHHSELPSVVDHIENRYRDFIGTRQIDHITIVDSVFDSNIITRRGRNIIVDGKHYVVIKEKADLRPIKAKPDYALVCRSFTGNIIDVYNTICPDTIILSYDLHPRRSNRYYNECLLDSIPVITRRD